jgi:hypothetical protein
MRIYGGIQQGGNLGQVAGGFSFPIRPEESDAKEEAQFKERFSQPGSWRQYIRDYQRNNPLQRQMPSAAIGNVGGLIAQVPPEAGTTDSVGMGFAPSFQNPVVIPEGFEQQLNQMEERARKQQIERFTNPGLYPQRYVY